MNYFLSEYGKVELRSHKMTQITEYKPLEDADSEYDVRSCPKKKHNHIAYFLCGHGVILYRKNMIYTPFLDFFYPNCNFYTPKITNLTENRGQKVKNICPIFNQFR